MCRTFFCTITCRTCPFWQKHFVTKSRCNYRTSTSPTSPSNSEMASFGTTFAGQQLPCAGAQSLARPGTAGKRCGRGRTITRSVMSPRKSQLDGWKEEQDKSDAFEKLQALTSRQSRNRKQKVGPTPDAVAFCRLLVSAHPHAGNAINDTYYIQSNVKALAPCSRSHQRSCEWLGNACSAPDCSACLETVSD